VWFVEREARGVSWGLGWEFFTPPAHLLVLSDVARLRRLDLASGRAATLEAWGRSPLVGRAVSTYRGRLFVHLDVVLRPQADGAVEYGLGLSIPRVPRSEVHTLRGVWADDARRSRGGWSAGGHVAGPSEPVVHGDRELFTRPGRESFPAAIVELDHADSSVRVLVRAPGARRADTKPPPLPELLAVSRKPDFDRVRAMIALERERVDAYQRAGASEGEAMLRAGRDLRDAGYYPKPERWIASPLSAARRSAHANVPRVDIDPMEIRVGLFPDLEEAMASPGVEVDRFGTYLRHRDYATSERLNALLQAGTRELVIAVEDRAFLFRLLPAEPASR
jgi:hypothetical protein